MGIFEKLFRDGGAQETESGVTPLQNIEEQTPDEKKLIEYIKNKVQEVRASSSRISHEGIWMTNVAYVLGFDSVYYDTTSRQFKQVGTGKSFLRRNRIHVNKILPTIQNRLARLCKNPPQYDVRPNSNDDLDKDAARLSLQILNGLWDKNKLNQKRIPLYMWSQQAGHAYIKVCWDDQLGAPMAGDAGLSYEGEVRADVVSAFEVFPDPLAKTLDDAAYVVQAKVRRLDYFVTHYPERGKLVKPEGAWLLSAQYEQRINSLNNQGPTASGQNQTMENCAIEMTLYEKRSAKHPMGRMVTCANGILLEDKDLPTGEIPFAKFDDIVVAGKFYSESIITHLRPIQDQYNRLISMRAKWTNRLLAGKYIAARGQNLMQESPNDESGEIVYYSPVPNATEPHAMQIPLIPQYAYTEEERLENMMYDISGINQISRGQLPPAGMPAIGMQLLTEQDDTRIGVMTENNEESWARIGMLMLKYAEKFYVMPRLLKSAGKNNDYNITEVTGEMIRGNTDVIVVRGSTLPGSKTLKRQDIMNTFQSGLLGDPNDPVVKENVLNMIEFGDTAEIFKRHANDMAQIKRDIAMIEQGGVPQVNEMDNHPLHIQEKNEYRKSEKFLKMAPEVQGILLADIENHVQALQKIMNPQGEMQRETLKQAAVEHAANQPPSANEAGGASEHLNDKLDQTMESGGIENA